MKMTFTGFRDEAIWKNLEYLPKQSLFEYSKGNTLFYWTRCETYVVLASFSELGNLWIFSLLGYIKNSRIIQKLYLQFEQTLLW